MRRRTALATAALAVAVTAHLVGNGPLGTPHLAVVAGVALATTLVAVRLWWTECFCARVGAGLLATANGAGEVLGTQIGFPGQPADQWSTSGLAVVVLAVTVLLLAMTPDPAAREDGPAHPYAL